MEKPLTLEGCSRLKHGDLILADAFMKDTIAVFSAAIETLKYPLSRNGKDHHRSLGMVDGRLKFEYASDVGETGEEKIMQYHFITEGGDFTVRDEETLRAFNVRIISKKHPKYDSKLSKGGVQFSKMFDMMCGMFDGNGSANSQMSDFLGEFLGPKKSKKGKK